MTELRQLHAAGSHFEVGRKIGQTYAHHIQRMLKEYGFFQHQIRAYHQTEAGQARYRQMLDIHQANFPGYIGEIEGIAQGADVDFADLFLVNLRGEYREFVEEPEVRGCSDCVLLNESAAMIAHNEDGSPAFADKWYFLHLEIEDKLPVWACSYPGFLCGNAFGFNAAGICVTIDNINPKNVRPGLARHFLGRALLEARTMDEAVKRITPPNRASGFTYNIGSVRERRVAQVEVTPDSYHIRETEGVGFHANHILNIEGEEQTIGESSAKRVERGQAIIANQSPTTPGDLLNILGDTADPTYPIYRTATDPDNLVTFCTAVFDLDQAELRLYLENPATQHDPPVRFAIPT